MSATEVWNLIKTESKHAFRNYFDPLRPAYWRNAYYSVKDFLFPHNVIKLKKLNKSYQETDTLMEEAILQLLDDYFQQEQPFHSVLGRPYSKRFISTAEHLELMEELYGENARIKATLDLTNEYGEAHWLAHAEEMYPVYKKLIEILEWYRDGGLNIDGAHIFSAAFTSGATVAEALEKERAHNQKTTDNLLFVIQNRGCLWT